MGRQIIKQPNGKLALWSTETDDFDLINSDRQGIVDYLISIERERIESNVDSIISKLERGEKPYFQFTKTYEDAIAKRAQVHGK